MRLPIIPPGELTAEQKPLFDDMKQGIAKSFQVLSIFATTARYSGRGIRGSASRDLASRSGNW